jgi:signal transduction histidine kinase/DNA-binding NarL/FixJ family response regulator/HPt (histidine-containing phosphotransfer) domain-containing protein
MKITNLKKPPFIISRLILLWLISFAFHSNALAITALEPVPVTKLIVTPPSSTANSARKVLVIYSYHDTLPWQAKIRDALFSELNSIPAEQRPELFEERFEAHRLSIITSDDAFLKLLAAKYQNVKLDLIVTENDFSYKFLNKYPNAFPNVKRQFITYTLAENKSNVLLVQQNVATALNTLLQVLPHTKRIIVIMESSEISESEKNQVQQNIAPLLAKQIRLELWNNFSFMELKQQVQQLSSDTAILYFPVTIDRLGEHIIPKELLAQLYKISPVPIFTVYDSFFGSGAVGGYMMSASQVGKLVAKAVLGLPLPKTRAEIDDETKGYYFDDVELKRWRIPDKNLPPKSTIINREISDWYKYRWQIAAAFIAFVFESLLVMALFSSLRQRKEATRALAEEKNLLDQRVIERTAELEESRNLAQSASRAKSDFLANMSHEIRTPMNAITGMTHLALRTQLTDKQLNYLTKIDNAAQSLLGIINDILDFSKIEAGKLSLEHLTFSIDDIFRHLADIVEIKATQKKLTLITQVSPQTPRLVVGDSLRLSQILINLVSNAIKFTDSGKIIVSVNVEEFQKRTVKLRFSVQDDGIGMTPKQVAELFQPFSQADTSTTRKYGGTGLGLVICKQLVELMNGKIWAQSQINQGSIFFFSVILDISEQNIFIVKSGRVGVSNNLTGRRVLLVEDNEINRELAIEMLNNLGISVEIAENGKQGVEKVTKEIFDLVLMDIQMPEMDGLTATRLIRAQERLQDLPILAMTAHAMMGDREKSLAAGMNDHLTKPIDPQKLTESLMQWMNATAPYSERVFSPPVVQKTPPSQVEKPVIVTQLPQSLPPFDIPTALIRASNNPKLLKKLILMFKNNYAQTIPQLRQMLANGQNEQAIGLAHSLKGVAGNLEATELYKTAMTLEYALREQNLENISTLLNTLENYLTAALAAAATLETDN